MKHANISLKGLEVFQAIARSGAVQDAARRLGVSVSTASHHLSSLEKATGVALFVHDKRPLRLTQAGEVLLRRVDASLEHLSQGMAEVWSTAPGSLVRNLRIGMIEDLDKHATPGLASRLSHALPACTLSFQSRPSHDIIASLQSEEIDIGVAATTDFNERRLRESPLLRDPYLVIAPPSRPGMTAGDVIAGNDLPFLRYSKTLVMGRRIDLQLRRLRLDPRSQVELESSVAMLSMVAAGAGWTISTALNLQSVAEAPEGLSVMPLPDAGFARQISVFRSDRLPETAGTLFEMTLRKLVQDKIVAPAIARTPWLQADFRLLSL